MSPFAPRKLRIRCFRGAKGDSKKPLDAKHVRQLYALCVNMFNNGKLSFLPTAIETAEHNAG